MINVQNLLCMKTPLLKTLGIIVLLTAFGLSLFRCTPKQSAASTSPKRVIQEPFQKVKIAPQTFTVSAETGGEIKLENGTRITVPPMAFVDKSGKPVTGEVQLKYREFHSAVDIMVSGIPMKFTDSGKEYDFESAGMFEINGYSGGQEVMVGEGKELNIQLAGNKADNDYNYYYFDTAAGQWYTLEKNLTVAENTEKIKEQEKLAAMPEPVKPVEPQEPDKNATIINLDIDYAKYPQFEEFNGLLWQYAGIGAEKDPKNNPDVFNANWKKVDLRLVDSAKDIYQLTINADKSTFVTTVRPVIKGKDIEKARRKFKEQQQKYAGIIEARVKLMETVKRQGDFVRSLSVSKFGIYNCDRYYMNNQIFAVSPQFEVDGAWDKTMQTVYHINKSDNSVVQYGGTTKDLKFNPENKNYLVIVLPGDKVAIADDAQFRKAKASVSKGGKYTFTFKTSDKSFNSPEELSQFIASI